MYQNSYQIADVPTKRKWYNPNRFTAYSAGLAFAISSFVLIALQFSFSYLHHIKTPYVFDILFTFVSQGCMLIIALAMAKGFRVSLTKGGGDYAEKPYVKQVVALLLILCGSVWVFGPLADFFPRLMFTEEQIAAAVGNQQQSPLFLLYFACIVVLPAVCEELLFRGVICRGLTEWGKVPAVLISALAFMLMHANPMQTVHQFAGGIIFGIIMVQTGNIYLCMLFHAFNNALGGLLSFTTLIQNSLVKGIAIGLLVCVGVCLLVMGIRLICRKIEEAQGQEIPTHPLLAKTEQQKKFVKERNHQAQGDYYYAIKREIPLEESCQQKETFKETETAEQPGEIVGKRTISYQNGKCYEDCIDVYSKRQALPKRGEKKWFYTDENGWITMNASSPKYQGAILMGLGMAINLALWIYVFLKIKTF